MLGRLHRDQRGTISILSVFTVMLLTMLLGMVMNVGRHVDGKIRMQNAADAAAYSGGVVLARGMNTLTFSNHLLCDVFALTAFLREARDRNAESYVPQVLAAWSNVGRVFSQSGFPKFDQLGVGILREVPLEQELVRTYGNWAAAVSELVLPQIEEILAQEMIPEFQRAVVEAYPDIAQAAAMEAAVRNGRPELDRGQMLGVLWRTSGQPVGVDDESVGRTLHVVDPELDLLPDQQRYVGTARRQREHLAFRYLRQWNRYGLSAFWGRAKLCQYYELWESFTCGQLNRLLNDEYPNRNLLYVIATEAEEVLAVGDPPPPACPCQGDPAPPVGVGPREHLDRHYTFLATVYWRQLPEMMPGLFRNPMENDDVAYAEVRMFIPRRRLVWMSHRYGELEAPGDGVSPGGVPGDLLDVLIPVGPGDDDNDDGETPRERWFVGRQSLPTHWDLLNQRWTVQLVPATHESLAAILQTEPAVPGFDAGEIRLPNLGGLSSEDIGRISTH